MSQQRVAVTSSNYPKLLKEIATPPKQLYIKGSLRNDIPLIAVIGSRKHSSYGQKMAEELSRELVAAGFGIVSGLAYGIDAVSHRATLDAGGYTVAVMAGGLDKAQPRGNQGLADQIIEGSGAHVSEHPPNIELTPKHFAIRNRIISGLSIATIVIEAGESSGSLITAKFALEQNRQVMAVPGAADSPSSQGTNNLIREGAALVTNIDDVLEVLEFID
ncbi:MAG: DNA-processing protein DprA [Candidatus Saccharimonadales bacterium]